MAREKVEDMIRKGYMVFEANTEYAGEPWELPANVLADFTTAFNDLRSLDAAATESQTQKENACAKSAAEQKKCAQIVWDLKKFIKVFQPDETLQEQMFHDLGIDEDLPGGDTEFITLLYEQLKPHLDDWDGTPQEIDADMKTEINAQITEYSTAVGGCDEWKANATTATEAVRQAAETFVNERARVRNWLYLKLPDQKYDAHLDEYGFEIWDKPTYGGGGEPEPGGELPEIPAKPTGFKVELRMEPSPFMLIYFVPYGADSGFDILRAATPGGVSEPPEMGDELFIKNTGLPLMDGEIMPGMKYWYQIRARNGEEVGEWTEIVSVEFPM